MDLLKTFNDLIDKKNLSLADYVLKKRTFNTLFIVKIEKSTSKLDQFPIQSFFFQEIQRPFLEHFCSGHRGMYQSYPL